MFKQQAGMSTMGIMMLAIVVVFGALLVMKVFPPYIEFYSVKRVLTSMEKSEDLATMATPEIRKSFDNRAQIDNIRSVTGADLEIQKSASSVVVTVNYAVKVPLIANISVVIDFNESVTKK